MKTYLKLEVTAIIHCDEKANFDDIISGLSIISDEEGVIVEDDTVEKYDVLDCK